MLLGLILNFSYPLKIMSVISRVFLGNALLEAHLTAKLQG